jgi:aminopeptidase N
MAAMSLGFGRAAAQADFVLPPNTYRSPANVHYWKNRGMPSDYWQQDVHYVISARLRDDLNLIQANLSLEYWNHSPDTLTVVYFHLYQNAFVKGSYYEKLQRANKEPIVYTPYEKNGKGTEVQSVKHNGAPAEFQVDNTIMRVNLREPLLPGASCRFEMNFTTYFGWGSQRRRMKVFPVKERQPDGTLKTVKHFDVVHWYPRVCVYDRNFRHATDQHLSREFYGEYGTYDVAISLPKQYVLEATGVLVNESEVMPPDLRQKLDLKNFASKKIGTPAQQVIAPDGTNKTWRFHAENVHDFAFTADPTYRIGETEWKGIRCIALAREENAAGWQDAADFTAKVIQTYSEDFGMYIYPKIIVADAKDGMEYPMLTLDGGISPGYKGLLAHEVGHNWFFGMIGTNETYRAYLDEGFTQFLTAWALEKIEGKYDPENPKLESRFTEVYHGYITAAAKGYDGFLNTHSDHFHGALGHGGGYGQVYYKTAVMLYNLQYVLGESLFLKAMQHYFNSWKIAHPYPDDFRKAITDVAKTDLTWFFDQWLETDQKLDYKVACVKTRYGGMRAKIKFKRKGRMQSPLDFAVVTRSRDTLHYLVPNTYFSKNDSGRTVLPRWYGWDVLNKTYVAELDLPSPLKKVVIDPSYRLGDVNLLDNVSGLPPVQWSFMAKPNYFTNWKKYKVNFFPNLWWNGYAGFQPGISAEGGYLDLAHKFRASVWYNAGMPQAAAPEPWETFFGEFKDAFPPVNVKAEYATALGFLGRLAQMQLRAEFRDGLQLYQAGLTKTFAVGSPYHPRFHRLFGFYKYMLRSRLEHLFFLNEPDHWNHNIANASLTVGFEKNYPLLRGYGNLMTQLRTAAPGTDVYYATLNARSLHEKDIFKFFRLRTRLFAQYGVGNLPVESQLYVWGGNPEEQYENDFLRARGYVPNAWITRTGGTLRNHFQYGGGLNLRGYAGYRLNAERVSGQGYRSASGAAVNVEIEFERFFGFNRRYINDRTALKTYLFYDGGVLAFAERKVGFDQPVFDLWRQDAGAGLILDVKVPDLSRTERNLTFRFDVPLWVSDPPPGEKNFAFRWILTVGRAF